MKKLVFFSLLKTSAWGGSENLWFKTVDLALKEGHKILIIAEKSLDAKNLIHLKNSGAEIFYLENHLVKYGERLLQIFNRSFAEKKFLQKLNNAIHLFNPDLMVINQPGCYDIAFNKTVANFLLLTKKKFAVCFHSYVEQNPLNLSEIDLMSNILVNSSASFFVAKKQAVVIKHQLKVDIPNIQYISNPLNLENAAYIPYPKTDGALFAMISSLDMNWKGHDVILNILAKPNWTKENWTLNIFGDGPDFDKITALIIENKLTDRVKLKGHVSDIEKVWATHQILLMPSRVDAAPAVLLEAMACGRAAVCTNIGFVEDWINDNGTGFIAADINTFEEALFRARNKSDHWEAMGKLANEKLIKTFPKKPEKQFLEKLVGLTII